MASKHNVFILTVRQQVIFPAIRTNITVSPDTFAELCDFVEKRGGAQEVGILTRKSEPRSGEDSHEPDGLYSIGTYCRIASLATLRSKSVAAATLTIEGLSRFAVERFTQTEPFRLADIRMLEDRGLEETTLVGNVQQAITELLTNSVVSDGKKTSHGQFVESAEKGGAIRNIFGGPTSKRTRWPASPSVLADVVGAGLSHLTVAERQQVLETLDVSQRLHLVLGFTNRAIEVGKLSQQISSKQNKRTEDELRETVLRRQLSDLQKEVCRIKAVRAGDADGGDAEEVDSGQIPEEEEEDEDDIAVLRESLKKAQLSKDAQKIAQRELRRLQNIRPHHPDYSVCRTYLETLASMPWVQSSQDDVNLAASHAILERDHYGLEKVKRRILEFLAVHTMRGGLNGPILCLHGPPGVGKTSLGRSIAEALGRKFQRIALGGVRDEAELRGHRRTYIGSMPGAIIQALISMKVNNPVILLDEVDKLTRNTMFNPAGAMLELLDPEQNNSFKDHYVNTPFDLSKVLFLCTCNDLHTIDRPLLDRMEVIELSGYTVEEKMHIAGTHLLPKQRKLHALLRGDRHCAESSVEMQSSARSPSSPSSAHHDSVGGGEEEPLLTMSQAAVSDLVTKWTVENGVRSLERRIAQVCRWAALRLAGPGQTDGSSWATLQAAAGSSDARRIMEDCGPDSHGCIHIDARHLPFIVGAELFEPDLAERLAVGVAMGLGVTAVGGQLLFVEASRGKGCGRLTVTGQLGEVMRESVSTAMSLLRSKMYNATLAAERGSHDVVRVRPGIGSVAAFVPTASSGRLLIPSDSEQPKPRVQSICFPAIDARGTKVQFKAASGANKTEFQDVFHELIAHADPCKDPFGGDDIHVHFPAGAVAKDGPSAGVATALALASLLLSRPVRSDTAVTGEITLRGHVLPVGGIREKILAANRAGVKHVLLPFGNQRQVKEDIPDSILANIELRFVKHIDEAFAWAFANNAKPIVVSKQSSAGFGNTTSCFSLLSRL